MRTIKMFLKWILAIGFVLAGINHFINTQFYLKIMPPVLPAPVFLIYLSGVFEIILGVMLLIPKFSRIAAWGLIALLVAVFPANIYMAMNTRLFTEFSPAALYLRLPMQIALIVLVFWFTKRRKETESEKLNFNK
jgi:uncharacterized membrane protein